MLSCNDELSNIRLTGPMHVYMRMYSWIADQQDAEEILVYRQTRRVATVPRPPLESSWQGESRSSGFSFVSSILTSVRRCVHWSVHCCIDWLDGKITYGGRQLSLRDGHFQCPNRPLTTAPPSDGRGDNRVLQGDDIVYACRGGYLSWWLLGKLKDRLP